MSFNSQAAGTSSPGAFSKVLRFDIGEAYKKPAESSTVFSSADAREANQVCSQEMAYFQPESPSIFVTQNIFAPGNAGLGGYPLANKGHQVCNDEAALNSRSLAYWG